MNNIPNYPTGLIALTTVLINSDGEISEKELSYIERLRELESIPEDVFKQVRSTILGKSEHEVYQIGIDSINACSDIEKLRAFVRLYHMAMADGVIHVKEVRLLLYAIKTTNVDINVVINLAQQLEGVQS